MSPCICCCSPEGTTLAQMAWKYVCNMLGQLSVSSSLLPSPHLSVSLHILELSIIHTQPFCLFCEPALEQKTLNPNHRQPERLLTCPKTCWDDSSSFYPSIPSSAPWICQAERDSRRSRGECSMSHDFRPQSTLVSCFASVCVAIVCLESDLKNSLPSCKSNDVLKGP